MNMLTNLTTVEVSTVKRGANRKRYAFTKSETETTMDIKQVISVPAEGEAEFVATLKAEGADEKVIEAKTYQYRMDQHFADVLKGSYDGDPTAQKDGESDDDYMKRAKKMGFKPKSKKAGKPDVENPNNGAPSVMSSTGKSDDPRVEELFKSNQALTEKVKVLTEKSDNDELVAKAASFPHVPGDLVPILKSARANGTEAALLAQWAMIEKAMQSSPALKSFGFGGDGHGQGNAYDKIKALAKQLTLKNDSGAEMTEQQKVRHVITKTAEGRALYDLWKAENPKQGV